MNIFDKAAKKKPAPSKKKRVFKLSPRKNYGFTEYFQKAEDMRERLGEVSTSMCLAKWLQVSINLANGTTQSCYHPPIHPVPLEELKDNPGALHNTKHKMEERELMLDGKRPAGCSYCWKVEDADGANDPRGHLSDRHYKSSEFWAEPYLEEVVGQDANFNVVPRYVEVNFNQACNFKCMYCSPHISTAWEDEIKEHGPFVIGDRLHNDVESLKDLGWMPIEASNKDNPYVQAFWEWWPTIYRKLRVFRMTGGEPLMDKNTFKVLDYVNENPHGQLELSITSNMCPPDQRLFDRFLDKVKALEVLRTYEDKENFNEFSQNHWYVDKGFKHFWLYVSLDGAGPQAEYMRTGLEYDRMTKNVHAYLSETKYTTVSFINTFNLLSITTLKDFLQMILDLRVKYGAKNQVEFDITPETTEEERKHGIAHKHYKQKKFQRIYFDIPLLKYPNWFDVQNAGEWGINIVKECVEFMEANVQKEDYVNTLEGFKPHEILKLKRNLAIMQEQVDSAKLKENKKQFYQYIEQYDQRRGTDFLATFPEMTGYYDECKSLVSLEKLFTK
jgi:organic radical activating enzyme